MIPNYTTTVTNQGSLGGQRKRMGLGHGEDVARHILSVLTDLYSDEEGACIREYSTNALDSHRDAGITRPIEVTLPSALSPTFKVKDYGVGMSVDEVQDIFAMYGESTKRGNNDTVGMLGLGSKSALTYTNSFTVVAVKNGVKSVVAIYKDEEGSSSEVVDTLATDEPNGVEVCIPVAAYNSFAEKSENFFKFWEPGTVLVNGEPPTHLELTKVAEGLYANESGNYYSEAESYIVMGNVAYPIENFSRYHDYDNYRLRKYGMVAYVPIGAVNFTPSREALHYTDRTVGTIREQAARFWSSLEDAARKEITGAPNHTEAFKAWTKWSSAFQFGSLTYKGAQFKANEPYRHLSFRINVPRYQVSTESLFSLAELSKYVFVHGYKSASISSTNKQKIRQYLSDNGYRYQYVALSEKAPDSVWMEGVETIDWSDIAAIRLNPAKASVGGGGSKKQFGFDYSTNVGGNAVEYQQRPLPSKTGKLLFISPTEDHDNWAWDRKRGRYTPHVMVQALLTALPEDATIVVLAANRWDKFKRDHPGAEHARSYANRRKEELIAQVSDDYRRYVGLRGNSRQVLQALPADRIDDPEVARMARFVQNYKVEDSEVRQAQNIARSIGGYAPEPDHITYALGADYPLVTGVHDPRSVLEHIVTYMNATYNQNQKEN